MRWVIYVVALLGGCAVGSFFALAALIAFAVEHWVSMSALILTGLICTFLPTFGIWAIMKWVIKLDD